MPELLLKSLNARIHEDVNLGHFGNTYIFSSIIVVPTIGFDRLCVISVILDGVYACMTQVGERGIQSGQYQRKQLRKVRCG